MLLLIYLSEIDAVKGERKKQAKESNGDRVS